MMPWKSAFILRDLMMLDAGRRSRRYDLHGWHHWGNIKQIGLGGHGISSMAAKTDQGRDR
jgi:hypothetical protein